VFNIGNNRSVDVMRLVELLEAELGRTAIKELVPIQPGDVSETCADIDDLEREVGFRPSTTIEDGVHRFIKWYRGYYAV
jgi:UDP-glucuronate 4-epimerase